MLPLLVITTQGSEAFDRLKATMPKSIEDGLYQIAGTFMAKIQGATPVGIRFKKFGQTKAGKQITKRARGKTSGQRYKGRWVASGALKKGWMVQGMADAVGFSNPEKYFGVLEKGKYKGIGQPRKGLMSGGVGQVAPRTTASGGDIFSSRAVGGIVTPIFENRAFQQKVIKTIADKIFAGFNKGAE
jgi:hypothetical protein